MLNFPRFTISTNDRGATTEGAEVLLSPDVSTPIRLHFCKRIRMLALLGVCMASCLMSYAQTQAYADYPRTRSGVKHWKQEDFPCWLSLDGQIRLRTEDCLTVFYNTGAEVVAHPPTHGFATAESATALMRQQNMCSTITGS
jgi:hypothetical protein